MSLRMNLYGWSFQSFRNVLATGNAAVMKAATSRFVESQREESAIKRGKAWIETLIERGFEFREERKPSADSPEGGLLTVQMETEAHVFAVYSIIRAIASDDHLDLSSESSHWAQPAVSAFYSESGECRFSTTKQCPREFHSWIWKLSNGTPLFGDDFRTDWSFYTIFTNQELAVMLPVFQAAIDFERPVPEDMPDYSKSRITTRLSEGPRQFARDLCKWFRQIGKAGQDAFILWW